MNEMLIILIRKYEEGILYKRGHPVAYWKFPEIKVIF